MLLTANLGHVALSEGVRTLFITLLFGTLLYVVLKVTLGSWSRAAALSAFISFSIFSYGYGYILGDVLSRIGVVINIHIMLLPLWTIATGLGIRFLLRRQTFSAVTHLILTSIAFTLVITAVFGLVYQQVISDLRIHRLSGIANARQARFHEVTQSLPNIYWIILDGYSRSDALLEDYDFDNGEFLEGLMNLGFIVPDCSLSNYPKTAMSLSSALQLNYLEELPLYDHRVDIYRDELTLHYLLEHNPVRSRLKEMGFEVVAVDTGFWFANMFNADSFLTTTPKPFTAITVFEENFLRTTAFQPVYLIYLSIKRHFAEVPVKQYRQNYDQIHFALDKLEQAPDQEGQKMVITHIISPHAPYVVNPDGDYVEYGYVQEGHVKEIQYLNRRILEIAQKILSQSSSPPVIVIQGDHGWEQHNRNKILNAYYLPGADETIYSNITPVNTFRIILNEYFGGEFDLLPDISYISGPGGEYDLQPAAPSCASAYQGIDSAHGN